MKIAVIDDNLKDVQIISEQLKIYFNKNYPDLSYQIFPFQEESAFLFQFAPDVYDLIFIDFYLNQSTGLDLAKIIRASAPSVILIFVTATRDFAIECYKVKASGYLVKPVLYDDLTAIMSLIDCQKIRNRQFIEVVTGYDKTKIVLRDIIYCDISGHYVQIHTRSTGVQKSRIPFSVLTKMLDPYPEFLPCYRGCIINMKHISQITDLTFMMANGERIPFRKKEKAEILRIYSDFLFEKVRNGK